MSASGEKILELSRSAETRRATWRSIWANLLLTLVQLFAVLALLSASLPSFAGPSAGASYEATLQIVGIPAKTQRGGGQYELTMREVGVPFDGGLAWTR